MADFVREDVYGCEAGGGVGAAEQVAGAEL